MKDLASMLVLASIWLVAIVAMGFFARVMFEIASVGWNLWP